MEKNNSSEGVGNFSKLIYESQTKVCKVVIKYSAEEKMVIKIQKYFNEDEFSMDEIEIMKKLTNKGAPYCVRLLAHGYSGLTTTIKMPYYENGDLFSLIYNAVTKRQHLTEEIILQFLQQIGSALNFMHVGMKDISIVHRDIKPENVFIDSNNNFFLGDFGEALIMPSLFMKSTRQFGTWEFMSPEMLELNYYNCKTDVYTMGCVLYRMITLKSPLRGSFSEFQSLTDPGKIKLFILRNRIMDDKLIKNHLFRNIFRRMTITEQLSRASLSQILELIKS